MRLFKAIPVMGLLFILLTCQLKDDFMTVYGFKGPSGVAMVKLFETSLKASGVTFTAEALPSADIMVTRFVSGEAKIGILPPNVAAKLAASGKPLAVVAVVGNGMLSLLTSNSSIRTPADLDKRTVHVAGQASTPDYVLRTILAKNGVPAGDRVRFDFSLATPEIVQALIAGRIENALLPEPFATMAIAGRPELRPVFDIQAEWQKAGGANQYPMTVLVVDAEWAASHKRALNALLEAYRESVEWVVANPDAAGVLVEQYGLGIKAAVAAKAIPKSNYAFVLAQEARPSIEALFKVFLEHAPASIGGKLPVDSFYYK